MLNSLRSIMFDRSNNMLIQFARYIIVGGVAATADISTFYTASSLFGINHFIANTMSFVVGLLVNYALSREWVFNVKDHHPAKDFILFAVIGVIGLVISNAILFLLIDMRILHRVLTAINSDSIKLIAKLAAVAIVFIWNFGARKLLVFRERSIA